MLHNELLLQQLESALSKVFNVVACRGCAVLMMYAAVRCAVELMTAFKVALSPPDVAGMFGLSLPWRVRN